jgi:hypothetical protein
MNHSGRLVRRLLNAAGTTYAAEAGIRMEDKPMPLFQLLTLCMPASKPSDTAQWVRDEYSGDLREIAGSSHQDLSEAKLMLKGFNGIGDTGAGIYLRKVQDVWTWVRPYFDDLATVAARQLGLPTDPAKLAELAPGANARLAAALVRVTLDDEPRRQATG